MPIRPAGSVVSDASPRAKRLATPRWLDARLVLGVILVLLAAVAGARVFASADHFTAVYVAQHALVPGERLRSGDLSTGQVRFDGEGGSYVAAGGSPPIGYLVTRFVAPGELVPLAALSAGPADGAGSRFVTVPVAPGHLPVDLGRGDLVDVYLTPKVAGGGKAAVPEEVLSAVAVEADDAGSAGLDGGSSVSVVLAVPAERVAVVVHAVESGALDLVEMPEAAAGAVPAPAVAASTPPGSARP